ncbi:hypothetical protein SASPL_149957 [Salvia splendens]|uniref:Transmembrane 9 superfamily member n=1 Tax=Salvia splendens TaxID=180675 RepID=A0A8X8Z278_SALSN|nr:hypothetical protein SASPL_149957 [Salvia splendens]
MADAMISYMCDQLIGDGLQVKVNKLLSAKTLLPYDYYYLKNCRPSTIRTDEVYPYYINNHLSFKVMYHRDEEVNSVRIVGIKHEVQWDNTNRLNVSTCNNSNRYMFEKGGGVSLQEIYAGADIIFSYDVAYKESDIKWASRWDAYLLVNDGQIHWFSIANSLLIMLFLCGTVAMIMIRTLRKGIASYDQLESKDEAHEETGWKLVHSDVFRPPLNVEVVCVCAGSELQTLGTTLATMIFVLLGCFSYFNHGWLMTAMASHELLWWLFLFSSPQNVQDHRLEEGCLENSPPPPRYCSLSVLLQSISVSWWLFWKPVKSQERFLNSHVHPDLPMDEPVGFSVRLPLSNLCCLDDIVRGNSSGLLLSAVVQ